MASMPNVRAAPLAPMRPRLPLKVMDGYILREMSVPFAFGLGAFFLFWFINIFFIAADELINSHASPVLVLRFLILRIPQCLPLAMPFACLLGTLLGFGRLVADNEITALRTSGVTLLRIACAPLAFGLAMTALTFWANDTLAPRAVDLSTRTFYQIVYNTATLPIVPQFFRKDPQSGQVIYVGNVEADQRTMDNVMIFAPATYTPFRQVTNAEKAFLEGHDMVLKNARVTRFKTNGTLEGEVVSKELRVGLPMGQNSDDFLSSGDMLDAYRLTSGQLRGQIQAMQATGQGGTALQNLKINLARKLSDPFGSFIAVVVALPLAVLFGRKGRSLGFALAVLVLFAYYLLNSAAAALGRNEALNLYAAVWLPNIIIGTAGALLFWRAER